MFQKKNIFLCVLFILVLLFCVGCESSNKPTQYSVSGRVIDSNGNGIEEVILLFSGGYGTSTTDAEGNWQKSGLSGTVTITPDKNNYTFEPACVEVSESKENIQINGIKNINFNITHDVNDLKVILSG